LIRRLWKSCWRRWSKNRRKRCESACGFDESRSPKRCKCWLHWKSNGFWFQNK